MTAGHVKQSYLQSAATVKTLAVLQPL